MMAGQVGLDLPTYEACMASSEAELAIRQDAAHGNQAGVSGTPAMFLSGLQGAGEFVLVPGGSEDVAALVKAHRSGKTIPAPAR